MKKLTIGRNNACDIIIPDTSDLVSRKQAVLTFSFWGKMVLYDTSNNGTYVNGQKLENGKGVQVTRKDKVNFARIADLDWNEVRNPYRKIMLVSAISITLVLVVSILLSLWLTQSTEHGSDIPVKNEVTLEKGETVTTVQPQIVKEQPRRHTPKVKKNKGHNKKGNSVTPNDVRNKEVNENSPIIY